MTCALRQIETSTPFADLFRRTRVTEASFCIWKHKYGKLCVTGLCELRQLSDNSERLKRVFGDLNWDKYIPQRVGVMTERFCKGQAKVQAC